MLKHPRAPVGVAALGVEEAEVAEVRKQVRLPGRPRVIVHKVRVTDDQEQRLVAKAAEQGVTVSRLLVDSALSGGADVAAVKAALVGELYGVQRLLGRVGVNINQIAKVTNATGEWQAATDAALEAVGRVCGRLEEFLVDLDRGRR